MGRNPLSGLAALAAVALAALTLAGTAGAGERTVLTAADPIESPTLTRINGLRTSKGLRPLRISAALTHAAESHATSMGRGGYFSHSSADGTDFWKRIQRFYGSSGFSRWTVGENLLWASPDVTPADAIRMWLASPSHRAVLLSGRWSEFGIAAVHVTAAPGVFGGRDVTIVAADFGSRSG